MNQLPQTRTILPRTSQPHRGTGLLLAPSALELEPCNSHSTPSPKTRPSAWQGTEDDASHRKQWSTHSLLSQPEQWQTTEYRCTAVRLHRHPHCHRILQGVSIKHHLSRIFPAHPRSLASVLIPRPAALGVLLRPCGRPSGLGFQTKNLPAAAAPAGRDFFFGASAERHAFGTWERGTSRRFAQECPEGNPGKYRQEK